MLAYAKAQSPDLFLSPSKSTPWWFHSVEGFKYRVLLTIIKFLSPVQTSLLNFQMHISNCLFDICTWISNKHHILNVSTLDSWSASGNDSSFPGECVERAAIERLCLLKRLSGTEKVTCGDTSFGKNLARGALWLPRAHSAFHFLHVQLQSKTLSLWQPWLGGITVLRHCGASEIYLLCNVTLFFSFTMTSFFIRGGYWLASERYYQPTGCFPVGSINKYLNHKSLEDCGIDISDIFFKNLEFWNITIMKAKQCYWRKFGEKIW